MRTSVEGGRVRLSVQDDGPGVPPGIRPTLFSRFATTKKEGSGLGLYLSRNIAESHGGSLELCDDTPRGATFTLSLPIGDSPLPHPPQETSP